MKDAALVARDNAILRQVFEEQVFQFLSLPSNRPILFWLDDSYALIQNCKTGNATATGFSNQLYYDYSFMITPAFKALELWIINIAPALGVAQNLIDGARERGSFRDFLGDAAIQKLIDGVVAKLTEKSKAEQEIRSSLAALNSYLKNLRHTPAHCGSIIEKPEKANVYFNEIVGAIDRITSVLIEEKIIVFKEANGMPIPNTAWSAPAAF